MKCLKCGYENPNDVQYCLQCGNPLTSQAVNPLGNNVLSQSVTNTSTQTTNSGNPSQDLEKTMIFPANPTPTNPVVSEPKVETPATPVAEPSAPVVEPTAPVAEPTTMNAKEEEVVSKLENTDMTPTKEEKKEELENTILLNKQLNDAKMAIKAEEAKKDPEKKNKNGLMLVIALFTVLIVAVVVIPFIFNYLNN